MKKERFDALVDDGWMISQRHPNLDLTIYNYSQRTQYEAYWVEETLAARGLVMNDLGEIVARPFGKFFNLSEHHPQDIPNLEFEVFEKMDGSLGILFSYSGQWIFASRGSFTSEQAIVANRILGGRSLDGLDPEFTYLFEIIYKSNRIVVDYGDTEDIVMLAAIHTKTSEELKHADLVRLHSSNFTIVKAYPNGVGVDALAAMANETDDNREGYVVRFSNGFRVKIKLAEYTRLHRIVTNVSSITIWEALRSGNSLDQIIDNVPDEFYDWVKKTVKSLNEQHTALIKAAREEYELLLSRIAPGSTRKDIALEFTKSKFSSYLFGFLDDRVEAVNALAWKQVKPEFTTPFKDKVHSADC